jgi:hypothetical protein
MTYHMLTQQLLLSMLVVAAAAVTAAVIPQAFEYSAKKSVRLCIIQSYYLIVVCIDGKEYIVAQLLK